MNPVVLEAFPRWTEQFEGKCSWMYLDVKGLVTTGIGNLIDPIEVALSLPWQLDGRPATQAEIRQCWEYVKGRTDMVPHGGYVFASMIPNALRLTDDAIADLVRKRIQTDWDYLILRFPDAEQWPSQAQTALLSMAWAMGPAFRFPQFEAAANAKDWATCAKTCRMNETGNPGLKPRNNANVALFEDCTPVASSI